MPPSWANYCVTGWTTLGRKVSRHCRTYEDARAVARYLPVVWIAALRPINREALSERKA